jgi:hypothetical protein
MVNRIIETDALTGIITTGINLPNCRAPRGQTDMLEKDEK